MCSYIFDIWPYMIYYDHITLLFIYDNIVLCMMINYYLYMIIYDLYTIIYQ